MTMKTALSIVQNYRYLMALDAPSSLLSLTDPDELQQLQFLYKVSQELRREGPFRQQIATHEFDTASGTNTYPLPGDFYSAMSDTYYNQDNDWTLIGPVSDSEFLAYKEGSLGTPSEYVWRVVGFDENSLSTEGRQLELYPTPGATENLSFQYVSSHLFVPPNWAASTIYTSGQFVTVNGRIYQCDTGGTSSSTPPSGTDNDQTDGTATWDYYNSSYDIVQHAGDRCIFDAELVELGLRAYHKLEKQKDPSEMGEFRKAIMASLFRWEGQTRARGDKGGSANTRRYFVPPNSWSIV